jgi:hypothetical protein
MTSDKHTAASGATDALCKHGFRHPVICPQCDPEAYEMARPQVERWLQKQADAGNVVTSL